MFVGVSDFWPDDLDNPRASLDQAASEKTALTEGVASVPVAHCIGFLVQIERIAGTSGDDEVQGFLIVVIEIEFLDGLFDFRHCLFDCASEIGSALETESEDFRREFEVFDLDPVHFPHVEVVSGRVKGVGIERFSEEPSGATFAHHVGFLEGAGEHDERKHGLLRGFEADDVCAEVWKILRVRRFELAGRAHLVGGVSGHDLVDGCRVVEKAVRGVAHRTDHGELVVHLGEVRKNFREVHPWDFGWDVLEGASDVVGDIFLGVPKVEVTWAALEIDHHDALGLVPACAAGFGGFRVGFTPKHGGEREAEEAGGTDAYEVTSCNFHVGIAEVVVETARDVDHRRGRLSFC